MNNEVKPNSIKLKFSYRFMQNYKKGLKRDLTFERNESDMFEINSISLNFCTN